MQAAVKDERNVVNSISQVLAERIGAQKHRIWFENSTKFAIDDDYLKIGVPNLFIANWIENHFEKEIAAAIKQATGENKKITFCIDPELAGQQRPTQINAKPGLLDKSDNGLRKNQAVRAKPKKKLKMTLDSFVVGSSNELAYNAAKAVAEQEKCPFNPLFVHGGYGVGKTHLLQGICNAVCKNRPQTNWLYLSAEDFTNQFVLALKTRKLEAFRSRMRQTDLLAIDDIHFLAGKVSMQEEFLHTFNSIDMAGKQVVLVSDAHPKMIGSLSDKLVNRFVSGMVVKVDNPDYETRFGICRQFAKRMKKHIPETVIKYIAEQLKNSVRELEGAMLKLIAFSALQNRKITLLMAREILAENLSRTDPIVHISDIESAVSTFFGITTTNLHSSKKSRTITIARHFSMFLARKHTKMSSPEIGRCMGNKNHATVLLACKRVEDNLKRNVQLNWQSPAGNKVSKARTILAKLEQSIA
jgi:chromosomal replication initiator protein